MQFLVKKSKEIILLLLLFVFFTLSQSRAQNITVGNGNNILSLSIECPNNLGCFYSGQKLFPMVTKIKNISDQNLEIPLEAIRSFLITSYLVNIKIGKIVGDVIPPGMPIPELLKRLTLIPAHSEIVMTENYTKRYLNKIFKKEGVNRIALYESINTYVYFEGSEKPIGFYKDGKFEPKQFILETERVITKQ